MLMRALLWAVPFPPALHLVLRALLSQAQEAVHWRLARLRPLLQGAF
jgi:hypothetical protein